MRIEIVIDELVLTGFDARDRHRIADVLQRELTRVAAVDPHGWRHAAGGEVVRAADCVLETRGGRLGTEAVGSRLADAVARALVAPDGRAGRPADAGPAPTSAWSPARSGPDTRHASRPASADPATTDRGRLR